MHSIITLTDNNWSRLANNSKAVSDFVDAITVSQQYVLILLEAPVRRENIEKAE